MARLGDAENYRAALADADRARTLTFWSGRRANLWPIDALGYTLLGNSLLVIGESIFAEWTGDEPWEAMVPSYDGTRKYIGDGFDAAFAVSLLQTHRPDLGARFDSDWTPYVSPLSDNEWLAVSEIYHAHWRRRRSVAITKMSAVNKAVSENLADGTLKSALRIGLNFQPIGADWWVDEGLNRIRFLTSQTDPRNPDIVRSPDAFAMLRGEVEPALCPGNAWIFVSKESLDALRARLSRRVRPPERPSPSGTIKLGAKQQYDWEAFRTYLFTVMDDVGDISPVVDPSWRQADLEGKMQDWCDQTWGRVPGESTIRTRVALFLKHWRESQEGQEGPQKSH